MHGMCSCPCIQQHALCRHFIVAADPELLVSVFAPLPCGQATSQNAVFNVTATLSAAPAGACNTLACTHYTLLDGFADHRALYKADLRLAITDVQAAEA